MAKIIRRCQFCGDMEDLRRCAWPALTFWAETYGDLEEGDRVKRWPQSAWIARQKAASPATVASIEVVAPPRCNEVLYPGETPGEPFLIIVLKKTNGMRKDVQVSSGSRVMVERMGVCGALACHRHRAERSDTTCHCADHWASWASVA